MNVVSGRIRFGVFALDLKAGELHRSGRRIRLQEQPFQILQMLVERAGEVVSREEIQSKLWPNDTVVEFDHGINTAIRKLRIALDNDDAETPSYIETVARRGYRLIMPVEWPQSSSDGGAREAAASDGPPVSVGEGAAARPQRSAAPTPGKTVSHYRVLNVIGGGGMGVVYRAEDLRLGRAVALKFLPEELGTDPIALGRFEREAQTASSLNHPNICTIYEVDEHEEMPFIVMEYLEGMTLRDVIVQASIASPLTKSRKPPMSIEDVLDVATQIAAGLEAAHQKGIIHRDIKPANIFVTRQRQVKILDFGLAKLITTTREIASDRLTRDGRAEDPEPAKERSEPDTENTLTRAGASLGTAGYMSPEQVEGLKLDARTDLFCFGLVLYEMTTGKRAFGGGTKESFREAVLHEAPVPMHELNPLVPPKLEAIITRCLEKDRNQRYQDASDLRNDLKQMRREMSAMQVSKALVAERIAEAAKKPPQAAPEEAAPKQPRRGPHSKWIVAAVIVAISLAVGLWYWQSRRTGGFTSKDSLVIADFINSTGDSILDHSMDAPLRKAFGQSPYINILSGDKVRRTLKAMNQSPGAQLTPALAREVCLRTNTKAFLTGSIADVGNLYRLEVKAVNCLTGKTLAGSEQDVPRRDEIVRDLGVAAAEVRKGLGEPKASLQRFNTPLDQALTPSLEALQAFSESGQQKVQHGDVAEMFSGLNRAVELDPNFAEAYFRLGVGYLNVGEIALSTQNLRRAYALRGRVTERTRFAIETFYYIEVTGEAEKSIQVQSEWARTYADDASTHGNLSADLMAVGQYERAVAEARESVRLLPTGFGYVNLMSANLRLNRLEEARAAFDDANRFNINDSNLYLERYLLAFLQNDESGMQQQLSWATNNPASQYALLSAHSNTAAYHGRLASATAISQDAITSAQHAGAKQAAIGLILSQALLEAEAGNSDRARNEAAEALAASKQRDIQALAAFVLARAGSVDKAENLVEELNRAFPLDTWIQSHELPAIRAAIQLQKNDPAGAIDTLRVAAPYELADLSFRSFPPVYPIYLRGEAYLKAGQGQMAAAEFQKIIDHPGVVTNFITGALARLQLARAQAMLGDKAAARKSYETFLTLWKDADPKLPILQQAKSEYAQL